MILFDSEYLKDYTKQIFIRMGCPEDEALTAADCLNQAD
jgi:LDH2 family malate/lactate/ureidoglycolate dehydrogenase